MAWLIDRDNCNSSVQHAWMRVVMVFSAIKLLAVEHVPPGKSGSWLGHTTDMINCACK